MEKGEVLGACRAEAIRDFTPIEGPPDCGGRQGEEVRSFGAGFRMHNAEERLGRSNFLRCQSRLFPPTHP